MQFSSRTDLQASHARQDTSSFSLAIKVATVLFSWISHFLLQYEPFSVFRFCSARGKDQLVRLLSCWKENQHRTVSNLLERTDRRGRFHQPQLFRRRPRTDDWARCQRSTGLRQARYSRLLTSGLQKCAGLLALWNCVKGNISFGRVKKAIACLFPLSSSCYFFWCRQQNGTLNDCCNLPTEHASLLSWTTETWKYVWFCVLSAAIKAGKTLTWQRSVNASTFATNLCFNKKRGLIWRTPVFGLRWKCKLHFQAWPSEEFFQAARATKGFLQEVARRIFPRGTNGGVLTSLTRNYEKHFSTKKLLEIHHLISKSREAKSLPASPCRRPCVQGHCHLTKCWIIFKNIRAYLFEIDSNHAQFVCVKRILQSCVYGKLLQH